MGRSGSQGVATPLIQFVYFIKTRSGGIGFVRQNLGDLLGRNITLFKYLIVVVFVSSINFSCLIVTVINPRICSFSVVVALFVLVIYCYI